MSLLITMFIFSKFTEKVNITVIALVGAPFNKTMAAAVASAATYHHCTDLLYQSKAISLRTFTDEQDESSV